ncbi:thiamine biosynthesis protein ThiF [Hassallia byssoidea VB512170]|uniref:Thiamine biosynthesis protein ThiF n=1 Tax=Hassallia byssoidea VB512170 TaxID=1304833 RepID=A0A846H3Z0_9CYAN|nr:ThiF family adenylyltransferase [Hassalia byssoidea]NEU71728.1 thiamine biosynthesis protein ThiF [Hassalia byssoidea VB512170]
MLELTAYQQALPVLPQRHTRINFILVGAGGTGKYLAEDLCRIILQLQQTGKEVSFTVVDGDIVSTENTIRQNYQPAEVGLFKADALALKCSAKYGIEITAICDWFEEEIVHATSSWNSLTVIIGCVDNAAARGKIHSVLKLNNAKEPALLFWLDCGNTTHSGQIVVGTHSDFDILRACDNPDNPKFWLHLPQPTLVHPELLVPLPEELTSNNLSCAEIQARNYQSLFINRMTSAIAAQYLLELTLTGGLKKFASYFDLKAMSTRSLYTSIDNLKKYHLIKKPPL